MIPCLDVDAGRVVKGVNFVDLRDAGDPVELAARYDAEGADELVFLDITASSDARDTIVDVVGARAEQVFIPFTVGGGIRTVDDARRLLRAGADKVSLNTAAVDRPELVAEVADRVRRAVRAWSPSTPAARGPTASRRRVRGVHPRRPHADRARRGRRGPIEVERAGRRRDPAHLDGPRRHQGRLRPRADPRRQRRRVGPGDRLGRRRHASTTWSTA